MAAVKVSLNGNVLFEENVDVCASAPVCPVAPRQVAFDQTIDVPAVPLPRATVAVTIRATDQNGGEAACLDISIDLVRGEEEEMHIDA